MPTTEAKFLVNSYVQQWGLTIEREIVTPSGIICFGKQGNVPIVLKVPHPHSDEVQQKDVLRYYNGNGAVRVLQAENQALLLERLVPGRPVRALTDSGSDAQATRIFCQTAKQLHTAKGTLTGFKTLAELASGFDSYRKRGDQTLSITEVNQAQDVFLSLLSSQAAPVLLHGDLHHDNILSDDVRGWVAIDPKGVIGEPAYEAGAWLRNPMGQYSARDIIEKRVAIMVEELGWNQQRIVAWGYAQAILSAIWSVEDKGSPSKAGAC